MENTWIDALVWPNGNAHPILTDWVCCGQFNGILMWDNDKVSYRIAATPDWNGDGNTPIELQDDDDMSYSLGELDTHIFASFEDYANAMYPYLLHSETIINNLKNSKL